jgi:fimbrial chaperone protein
LRDASIFTPQGTIMRRHHSLPYVAMVLAVATSSLAQAAALQVAPVRFEIPAPGATATLTVRNEGPTPLNAQVRVFRWTQANGKETLEPSNAVVASPPTVTLQPRMNYSVRIVRTSRQPVAQEEAYRLMVDQLPDVSRPKTGTVQLLLRHSIPVFFVPPEADAPRLTWSVRSQSGRITVTVKNEGGRRVQISGLRVKDASGKTASFGDGLVGYVLAGSTMSWTRSAPRGFGGKSASIIAKSDTGPINAGAAVTSAR